MKKRVPAAEARAGMKDLVDAVKEHNARIKITRYGKTVAYLVPTKDGEALENCGDELEECRQKGNHAAAKGGALKGTGKKGTRKQGTQNNGTKRHGARKATGQGTRPRG